jgi:hypothetical protein
MRHHRTLPGASADPSAGPYATWRQPTLRALIANSWGRGELRGDDPLPGRAHKALLALVIGQRGSHWKIIAAHNTNIFAPPT